MVEKSFITDELRQLIGTEPGRANHEIEKGKMLPSLHLALAGILFVEKLHSHDRSALVHKGLLAHEAQKTPVTHS